MEVDLSREPFDNNAIRQRESKRSSGVGGLRDVLPRWVSGARDADADAKSTFSCRLYTALGTDKAPKLSLFPFFKSKFLVLRFLFSNSIRGVRGCSGPAMIRDPLYFVRTVNVKREITLATHTSFERNESRAADVNQLVILANKQAIYTVTVRRISKHHATTGGSVCFSLLICLPASMVPSCYLQNAVS